MPIFRCSVRHRSGAINDRIYKKVLFIKADSPVAAYVKAEIETKGINREVYPPVIQEWEPPRIDFECSLDDVMRECGTLAVNAAAKATRYVTIYKTSDGTRE